MTKLPLVPQTPWYEAQIPMEDDPETGLPIGPVLKNPKPADFPSLSALEGRYCRLERLHPHKHTADLFAASTPQDANARFRYLPDVPPKSEAEMADWIARNHESVDPMFFAVVDKSTGRVEGRQSYLRITPEHQGIEIGHIYWGPGIAKTAVTTEANYLFAKSAFELGYRRYEWKCDALNAPSRKAALRFGFTFEGLFRRAVIVKGRSRDTAWYSIIDEEWPALQRAYESWLSKDNFDAAGRQIRRLTDFTAA